MTFETGRFWVADNGSSNGIKNGRSPSPGGGRRRSLRDPQQQHLRFHESFEMTETVTVTQIKQSSFRMTDVRTSSSNGSGNGGIPPSGAAAV